MGAGHGHASTGGDPDRQPRRRRLSANAPDRRRHDHERPVGRPRPRVLSRQQRLDLCGLLDQAGVGVDGRATGLASGATGRQADMGVAADPLDSPQRALPGWLGGPAIQQPCPDANRAPGGADASRPRNSEEWMLASVVAGRVHALPPSARPSSSCPGGGRWPAVAASPLSWNSPSARPSRWRSAVGRPTVGDSRGQQQRGKHQARHHIGQDAPIGEGQHHHDGNQLTSRAFTLQHMPMRRLRSALVSSRMA